jgi:hypothetical protein
MITIFIGDNKSLAITWQTSSGPIDITGSTMFFTVKTNISDPDSSAIISKTWNPTTFTDPGTGITYDTTRGMTLLSLLPSDTGSLAAGTYYWNIRMKSAGGSISSTNNSTLLVIQGITQRSS